MTTREKVLVSILAVICVVGAFMWFYLIPMFDRMDQVRREVNAQTTANDSARVRSMSFMASRNTLYGIGGSEEDPAEGSLYALWQDNMYNIVEVFDRSATMRSIEMLVNPRVASDTSVAINFGETRQLGALEVHPSTVSFTAANRIALMNILESFESFPVENRIVTYHVSSRAGDGSIATGELSVSLTVEFLSQAS